MRFLILWGLMMVGASAQGRNEWYAEPLRLNSGVTVVDTIPVGVATATLHVRLSPSEKQEASWRLMWDMDGAGNGHVAEVEMPGIDRDDIYGQQCRITLLDLSDSAEVLVTERSLPLAEAFVSVKIVYDGYSARLFAGCNQETLIDEVEFGDGGMVAIEADSPLLCRRITSQYERREPHDYSDWSSISELNSYLGASDDAMEGKWRHLDRDVNLDNADLGGKYALATVSDGDGEYEIVYLGGATVNGAAWKPLRIKGRLKSTIFQNNYDMEWIDAYGQLLGDDNNAQLSDDGQILTLHFPVYDCQLRFQRAE